MESLKFIKEVLGKSSDTKDKLALCAIELLEIKLALAESDLKINQKFNLISVAN